MIKHKIVLGVTQLTLRHVKEGMATSKSWLLAIHQNPSIQAFPVEIMFSPSTFSHWREASEQLHQQRATAHPPVQGQFKTQTTSDTVVKARMSSLCFKTSSFKQNGETF